ncbi:MAG: DNA-processing protein DprA [Bacteroidales bacterium]|nr:DNA-processing protein DprA [Bacteroidales bacterium]
MSDISKNQEDIRYKIAIGLIPKIGPILTKRLIAYCGSVEGVFNEKKTKLSKIPGIAEKLATLISNHKNLDKADQEIEFIEKHRIKALFYLDHEYPERLKLCEDAPIIIYVKGDAILNRQKVVSIVGTRNPTDYGRSMTRNLVEQIAASHPDMLIVSGLAYGIDICAHKSALKNNVDTVGILGHGLSTIYPSAHRETAKLMVEKGALVTEFRHDEKPESPNFVKRNRIIAGLADATIVVESGEQGGALITADIANSYNRDVFAFPGRVDDKYSIGCNRLVKTNRAAMMETLEDLEYLMGWQRTDKKKGNIQGELFTELTDEEKMLTEIIRQEPAAIDQIAIRGNMPVSKASGILLNLEFKGIVKCLPGKVYQLT